MAAKKLRIKTQPRNFSLGGAIGAPAIDPNGSDYDAINAEKTARWAAEDAAKAAKYGIKSDVTPLAERPTSPVSTSLASMAMQQPGQTTWQQDMDARQNRIAGYTDKLRGMEQAGRANSLMGSSSSISTGYENGGKIDAEELMRQMTAKYGAPAAGPSTQPPVQQVPQQPKQQPPVQPQPQGIVGIIKNRGVQIDKAVNGYARGGKPRGIAMEALGDRLGEGASEIKGPGTASSDSIPAVVGGTGEPIRVANGERIVSVAQDRFLERYARAKGFESLDAMLEEGTGKPVGPTIKAGKRAAADGMQPANYRPEINGLTWDDKRFDPTKEQMAQGTGAIAIKTGPNAGKNIAIGPQNYTAADGSSTSDWSKTAQYAQGLAQAQKDRDTLATMQRDRLERDAYDPSITDPNVQSNARAQIVEQDAKAAKFGEAQGRMLDNQLKHTKLASEGAMAGLQAQYLAETDPTRRSQLAEQIRGINGKGDGAQQWQHVETERGMMAFNPKTLRMEPISGPDGAPVMGNKPLTEFQGKSTGFGMRAENASGIIDQVGKNGAVQPSLLKRAVEDVPLVGGGLGMLANKTQSPEQQQIEQAQRDFVNAVLRQESGAAISKSEFDNAKLQYFPQPGDSPKVIAQKKANREMAVNGFRISAGPGAKNFGGAPAQPQQPGAPKVGMVEGGHVYLGGNPADPASWKAVQ
uniref:Uncharacterized protein n=1 Tax=Dechloromonas aromatica (strain RCB) TaxID=159087 RepID=Q47CK9_DECAR